MRKVLAILLVLCMVCTMSVVAFAANPITKDTEQIGSTIVKTIGQGPTDPDVPGANEDYTVTIPAELIVPWDCKGLHRYGYSFSIWREGACYGFKGWHRDNSCNHFRRCEPCCIHNRHNDG